MFFPKAPSEKTRLDEIIEEALIQTSVHDDDFADRVNAIEKLYKMKAQIEPKRISPDTAALVLGNIAAVVLILGHERANVVTSKAMTFVSKLR